MKKKIKEIKEALNRQNLILIAVSIVIVLLVLGFIAYNAFTRG
jgi:CHASE3 domain sensor protein